MISAGLQKGIDGGTYFIETSPLIYSVNQWTGFYMIGTLVVIELQGLVWMETKVERGVGFVFFIMKVLFSLLN